MAGRDSDVPLSGRGRKQARAAGIWLIGVVDGPDLAVCSPSSRARQIWQAMADHTDARGCPPLPLLVDERLRDREMGVFELHPPAAIRDLAPGEAARRELLGGWAYRPSGGEALSDVVLRVRDLVTELECAATGRRVLLVAHDAVVIALRIILSGLGTPVPDELPPVPNASVSHWSRDGHRLHLTRWGDTARLR